MMFNIPEYENVFRIPEKIFDLFLVQVYIIHERKNEGKAREDHTERDGKEDLRMAEKNNSLEKALTVLDLFQLQRRITLTSAAQETGYSTAAVSRIFNSLESTGYVYRDKLDGGYYLADKVYLLGRSTNLKQQLVNVIDEPIARLCMRTGLSVTVSIRDRVNSVTAMRKDPKRGLFLTSNVADSISLNCSASGKVLTAFSTDPDKLIESIVDSENIRIAGYVPDHLAAGHIEFRAKDNPDDQITAGKIKFKQYLSPYVPAKVIENDMEYDLESMIKSLFGSQEA